MHYLTTHAQEIDRLFSRYADAVPGKPGTVDDLKAFNDLLAKFQEFARPANPSPEARLLVHHIFELGLVIRIRCDTLAEKNDPLAPRIRSILLAVLRHLWSQTTDRSKIGEKYIEAVFRSVHGEGADGEAIYEQVVGVLRTFLARPGVEAVPKGQHEFEPALRLLGLLAWVLRAVGHHDAIRGIRRPDTAAMTDLVFYDWSLGLAQADAGQPYFPDDLPTGIPVHVADAKGRSLGAPLLRAGRLAIERFNLDLLVNLAVWRLEREPSKAPADDLKALWAKLDEDTHDLAGAADAVERVPLIGAVPHANYGRETESEHEDWAECKGRWLRRDDVLYGRYAVRFWAANNAYLRRVFESWGWVAFRSVNRAPDPVRVRLDHFWPLKETLERFAGRAGDGQPVTLTLEEQRATENLVSKFAPKDPLADAGIVLNGAAADKGVVMAAWNMANVLMMTIGVTGVGKTWTDMAIIDRVQGVNRKAGDVEIAAEIPGFYTANLQSWKEGNYFKTEADQHATLSLTNSAENFAVSATLRIRDAAGGEFAHEALFVDATPTDGFTDLTKRLKEAGVVAVALDVVNLLRPRHAPSTAPDDVAGASHNVGHEERLLVQADKQKSTGMSGSPIALLLTKVDLLGLSEPLNDGAALFSGSPPDRNPKAPLGGWFDDQSGRCEAHARLQYQFLHHRLRHGWQQLLDRLYRGPIGNQRALREAAVFLTCGRHAILSKATDDEVTGVDAFTAWAAQCVMQRWAFTLHQLADGFIRAMKPVHHHAARRVVKLMRLIRGPRLASIDWKDRRRRKNFNLICSMLEQDMRLKNDRAAEADVEFVARIDQLRAQIEKYRQLVTIYSHAMRGAEELRDNTRPKPPLA